MDVNAHQINCILIASSESFENLKSCSYRTKRTYEGKNCITEMTESHYNDDSDNHLSYIYRVQGD